MMKRLAIGCGILGLLIGVTGVLAGHYVYRQVRPALVQFAELARIPDIERAVRLRGSFVPPMSGELTTGQVERLVRVQALVRERLGERVAVLEDEYTALLQRETVSLRDLPEMMAAYGDLVAVWLDAKRRQVEALNDVEFSLEEYQWVRDRAYRALGQPFADFDIGRLVDDITSGRRARDAGSPRGADDERAPDENRTLIERFRQQLEENLPLASLGL